jgi:hypothetical protein
MMERGQLTASNTRNKGSPFSIQNILYANNTAAIFLTEIDLTDGTDFIISYLKVSDSPPPQEKLNQMARKWKAKPKLCFLPAPTASHDPVG